MTLALILPYLRSLTGAASLAGAKGTSRYSSMKWNYHLVLPLYAYSPGDCGACAQDPYGRVLDDPELLT